MRKQYHFWPGDEGLDAWDVDRLIDLSRDLLPRKVELASISDLDTPYWFMSDHHPPTVRNVVEHVRLISDVDRSYPIILSAEGRVMDGMHRVAHAILNDETDIEAVQFEVDPVPDYRNCDPADLPY